MGLIAMLNAALRHWMPRTYVRVDDTSGGGWFVCELSEAAENVAMALHEQGRDGEPWAWRDDRLVIGSTQFTFVRMSPRRFNALPEFEGF